MKKTTNRLTLNNPAAIDRPSEESFANYHIILTSHEDHELWQTSLGAAPQIH